jgi:signal transduction histidine kinase
MKKPNMPVLVRAAWYDLFFRRLLLISLAIIAVLITQTYLTHTIYRSLLGNFNWVERTLTVRDELEQIGRDVAMAESNKRAHLATTEPSFKARFDNACSSLTANLDQAGALIVDPQQRDSSMKLHALVTTRVTALQQTIATVPQADSLAAQFRQGGRITDDIYLLMNAMYQRQSMLLEQRRDRAFRSYRMVRLLTFSVNILIVLLSLLAGLLVIAEIRRRNRVEQDLLAAGRQKDRFFSIISHDLRAPFASILGLSDMMADTSLSLGPKKLTQMGRLLNETSQNTYRLLQNLLDWSRLQMEHYQAHIEPVSLDEIIRQELTIQTPAAAKKDITLLYPAPAAPPVLADRDMIATVVRNLLSNAVKFTPHRGAITITAARENAQVVVAVADTGVGIPDSLKDGLFRIGQHTTTKGTDREKGTGLGLVLCREFIEKMGGRIWVTTAINQGSTFSFSVRSA